ncbi:hypothetical protein MBGDC06_00690, partial [Thermoplasmatales archaeon SCGC AB-539-C06]
FASNEVRNTLVKVISNYCSRSYVSTIKETKVEVPNDTKKKNEREGKQKKLRKNSPHHIF